MSEETEQIQSTTLLAELKKAHSALCDACAEFHEFGRWRIAAHEYDDEMGYPDREFGDEEEWRLMEEHAQFQHDRFAEIAASISFSANEQTEGRSSVQ